MSSMVPPDWGTGAIVSLGARYFFGTTPSHFGRSLPMTEACRVLLCMITTCRPRLCVSRSICETESPMFSRASWKTSKRQAAR